MRVRDQDGNVGFSALTGEYEDLISAGEADPADNFPLGPPERR